ncbi:MAG: DUF456 domain-containing protein [Prevotella sp.]|nr:DUF456 domain-containing protein [Prevotella sp.]
MERNIEQCPKCGNFTEGKPVYSQTRQITRAAVKKGSSKLIGAGVGFVVGIFFGIVGCVPGAIIGYIIGLVVSSSQTVSDLTDGVDQSLYSSTDFQFDCPRCGHSWRKVFQNGADTIPDSIIAKQQADLVKSIRGNVSSNIAYATITGVIALACGYYCFTHESSSTHMENVFLLGNTQVTDYNWTWWFLGIVLIVTAFIAIVQVCSAFSNKSEADHIESMTVSEFRNSSYRR